MWFHDISSHNRFFRHMTLGLKKGSFKKFNGFQIVSMLIKLQKWLLLNKL